MVPAQAIPVSREGIAAFCRRGQVAELSLFGSALREDCGPESDIDLLVSFLPGAPWSLLDLVAMRDELEALFGRPVDLVEKEALRNPFRRHAILTTRQVLYTA